MARAAVRGLYGIADAAVSDGDPVRVGAAMLAGGCRLVQLRCKHWSLDDTERAAKALVTRCHAVGATFIVNDHPELAALVGADGVHVGQLDAATASVRAIIGPDRLLGRSTHALDQLHEALRDADYVALGPIWPTPNAGRPKPVQHLSQLRLARSRVPPHIPLVAIGGITAARLPGVQQAGADAWAVIGAICGAPDPEAATRSLLG